MQYLSLVDDELYEWGIGILFIFILLTVYHGIEYLIIAYSTFVEKIMNS